MEANLFAAELLALIACWGLETECSGVYHGHDGHGGLTVRSFVAAEAAFEVSRDYRVVTHLKVLSISCCGLDLAHHPLIFLADGLLFAIFAFLLFY